jgi:hypothetical protein
MFFKISEALFGVGEGGPRRPGDLRGGGGKPVTFTPRVFDTLFGDGTPPNRRTLN